MATSLRSPLPTRQGERYAVGAVSPNTIDLLLEAGYLYLGNGLADDIPYYSVSDFASRRALLTLPITTISTTSSS